MCEPAEPWPRIDAVSYGQARLKLRRRRPAVRHHDLTQSDFRIIIASGGRGCDDCLCNAGWPQTVVADRFLRPLSGSRCRRLAPS